MKPRSVLVYSLNAYKLKHLVRYAEHYAYRRNMSVQVLRVNHAANFQTLICRDMAYIDAVFMWGGHWPGQAVIKKSADKFGAKTYVFSDPIFKRRDHILIDSEGSLGGSSLMHDPLDWVGKMEMYGYEAHRDHMHNSTQGMRSGWVGGNGHVLGVVELINSYDFLAYSPFRDLQEMVAVCESIYPENEVWWVSTSNTKGMWDNIEMRHDSRVFKKTYLKSRLIKKADGVFGIANPMLYDALMWGAPITVHGQCPLLNSPASRDKLMAAILRRTVPIATEDIQPWLDHIDSTRISGMIEATTTP
jgi:hypothetical protein